MALISSALRAPLLKGDRWAALELLLTEIEFINSLESMAKFLPEKVASKLLGVAAILAREVWADDNAEAF